MIWEKSAKNILLFINALLKSVKNILLLKAFLLIEKTSELLRSNLKKASSWQPEETRTFPFQDSADPVTNLYPSSLDLILTLLLPEKSQYRSIFPLTFNNGWDGPPRPFPRVPLPNFRTSLREDDTGGREERENGQWTYAGVIIGTLVMIAISYFLLRWCFKRYLKHLPRIPTLNEIKMEMIRFNEGKLQE